MTQADFVTALEMALQHCGVLFDRRDVLTIAADVWPLADEDPGRWVKAFLEARREGAGA